MNEIDYLRAQIALEQQHYVEAARIAVAAKDGICAGDRKSTARNAYLAFVAPRIHARLHAHYDALRVGPNPSAGGIVDALARALGQLGPLPLNDKSEDISIDYIDNLMRFIDQSGRQIDVAAHARYAVADWRRVARVDADSILEENRRYAELQP